MTENGGPSLSLFELIHPMSPSPTPQIPDTPVATASVVAKPVIDWEEEMRNRISEMDLEGLVCSSESSEREKELAKMVLKLTAATGPDSDQLFSQAEVISALTIQRDLIIKQAEEDRARFDVEREGWDRMAEALIAQQNRVVHPQSKADSEKTEQLERQCSVFQSENKFLRDKLNDTQSRLSSLESELAKLRPILLMQPVPPSNSNSNSAYLTTFPYPPMTGGSALAMHKARQEKKKSERPKEIKVPPPVHFRAQEAEEGGDPDDNSGEKDKETTVINPYTLPTSTEAAADPGPYAHLRPQTRTANIPTAPPSLLGISPKRTRNQTKRMYARSGMPPPSPISSDARNEHLLLAARRIGKERVGVLMGIQREREYYRTKEKEPKGETAPRNSATPGASSAAAATATSTTTHALPHFTVPMGYYSPGIPAAASGSPRTGAPSIPYMYIQSPGPAVMIPYPPPSGTATSTPTSTPAAAQHQSSKPPQQQQQQQQSPPQQQPKPPPPPPPAHKPKSRAKGKHQSQSQSQTQGKKPAPPSKSDPKPSSSSSASGAKNSLDSLLDAARKIENTPPTTRSRRRSSDDDPSPPKRPRLEASSSSGTGVGRVRSALDLLAEEAASHSPAPPPPPSTSGRPVRNRGPPRERRMIENSNSVGTVTRRMSSRARMIEPPKVSRKSVVEEEEEEKDAEGEKEGQQPATTTTTRPTTPTNPPSPPPAQPAHQPASPPPAPPAPPPNGDGDGSVLGDTDADGDDDPGSDADGDPDVEMEPPSSTLSIPARVIQPAPTSTTATATATATTPTPQQQQQQQPPKFPLVSYSGHVYGQGGHYRPSVFAQSREEES